MHAGGDARKNPRKRSKLLHATLRDLAHARRHAKELGAITRAWETLARDPTLASLVGPLHVLAETLRHEGTWSAEARAVPLAALRVANRMLAFRRHYARADVGPETAGSIARDTFADLDAYEREPRARFVQPIEDIWEARVARWASAKRKTERAASRAATIRPGEVGASATGGAPS